MLLLLLAAIPTTSLQIPAFKAQTLSWILKASLLVRQGELAKQRPGITAIAEQGLVRRLTEAKETLARGESAWAAEREALLADFAHRVRVNTLTLHAVGPRPFRAKRQRRRS